MPGNRIGPTNLNSQAASAAVEAAQKSAEERIERNSNDPHWLENTLETNTRAVVLEQMRAKAGEAWLARGGPASELGLPLSVAMEGQARPDGTYAMPFRGGQLVIGKNGEISTEDRRHCTVILEGLHLQERQERGDEIFGAVYCWEAGTDRKLVEDIPLRTVGHIADDRVMRLGILLYEGPPTTLHIGINLFEHDSGDIGAAARGIRKHVGELAARAMAGGDPDGSASAIAAKGFSAAAESLTVFPAMVAGIYADIAAEIFGTGDDPYQPITFLLTPEMMSEPPPVSEFVSMDPRTLTYTNVGTAFSYDDGGDRGQISAYLRIEVNSA